VVSGSLASTPSQTKGPEWMGSGARNFVSKPASREGESILDDAVASGHEK